MRTSRELLVQIVIFLICLFFRQVVVLECKITFSEMHFCLKYLEASVQSRHRLTAISIKQKKHCSPLLRSCNII